MTPDNFEKLKEVLIKQQLEAQVANTRMIADLTKSIKLISVKVDDMYSVFTESSTGWKLFKKFMRLVILLGGFSGALMAIQLGVHQLTSTSAKP